MNVPAIKHRKTFLEARKSKKKIISKYSIVVAVDIEDTSILSNNFYNIGYIVSKKIGNAVARNRIKRIYRQLAQKHFLHFMFEKCTLVIIAKTFIINKSFAEIENDFIFCLKKIAIKLKS